MLVSMNSRGAVDRAVDMAFGGKMHDRRRAGNRPAPPSSRGASQISALDETKARMVRDRRERVEIAGIGELVDDKDMMVVAATACRTKAEPINPAPPVTRKRFGIKLPCPRTRQFAVFPEKCPFGGGRRLTS